MAEAASIISRIFGLDLIKEVRKFAEVFSTYRGKYVRATLKDGQVFIGLFEGLIHEPQGFKFKKEDGTTVVVPHDSVYTYEILKAKPEVSEIQFVYGFQRDLKYTLKDYPLPFISSEGQLDSIFAYGVGKRDYDEYLRHLEKTGQPEPIDPLHPGRRGDFDYLPKLATTFGFSAAKAQLKIRSELVNLQTLPYGRQSFLLSENEKENNNIISIGSGSVNQVTREVLAFYGENIPVHFERPESDQCLHCLGGTKKTFDARLQEDEDVGFLEMIPSPYNPNKVVLIAAGLRHTGTSAALLALCTGIEEGLTDRFMEVKGKKVAFPVQILRAKEIEYINGIAVVKDFTYIK